MSREDFRRHLYARLRDYTRDAYPNAALTQEVCAIIHREHVLAGGIETDPECPNCTDMAREAFLSRMDEAAAPGMHKIKVNFTGLGKVKTLTYQTAQDVKIGDVVQVPRWPDMPPGPPLHGTVVALSSDYQGNAVTIIGG